MDCQSCKTKDAEIIYLREMVSKLMDKQSELISDMMNPYKASNQVFKPTYVNEKGEVVEYGAKEKDETQKTDVLEVQLQAVDVVNEILGH